ncbi:MAG: OmpA family protein [Desulfuromonadales bacterium]
MDKTKQIFSLLAGIAVLALAACAGTPPENQLLNQQSLDQARAAYFAALKNPQVTQYAPMELNQAQKTLMEAERLYGEGADPHQISHQAYLADQQVAIARQAAVLNMTQKAIADAGTERQQILLQTSKTRAGEAGLAAQQEAEVEAARQLASELQAELQQTSRGMVIALKDVFFASGQAELNPGAERTITKMAEFLKQHPDQSVIIEGFTDSTGSTDLNLALSEARAEAVRSALLGQGIESERIIAQGLGEQYPIANNNTAAGRQLNRRVEIVIDGAAGSSAGLAGAAQPDQAQLAVTRGMNLHSASQLIGAPVLDPQGQRIGLIRDVMINLEKGRASFIQVSSEDGKRYAVPLGALTSQQEGNFVTLNAETGRIQTSPQPQKGMTEEQFGKALYEHYGLAYPWEEEQQSETPTGQKGMPESGQ